MSHTVFRSAAPEQSVLHVKEVATGKETGDLIDRANFDRPAGQATTVSYTTGCRNGAGRTADRQITSTAAFTSIRWAAILIRTSQFWSRRHAGRHDRPGALSFAGTIPVPHAVGVVVNGVQREVAIYTATLTSIAAGKPDWKKVVDPSDEVTDSSLIGDSLYLLTHKGASRFKVLRLDLNAPDLAKAAVVVPPSESVITGLSAAKDALYVRRMNGSTSDLLRVAHTADAKPIAVKLPFDADISALATDVRVPGVIYGASAWTRFGGFYFYDPRTSKVTDTGLQPEGPYDHPDDLVAIEVKVASHDGTLVPLSIVHGKG
jgi:prolyl oligopeptidase